MTPADRWLAQHATPLAHPEVRSDEGRMGVYRNPQNLRLPNRTVLAASDEAFLEVAARHIKRWERRVYPKGCYCWPNNREKTDPLWWCAVCQANRSPGDELARAPK